MSRERKIEYAGPARIWDTGEDVEVRYGKYVIEDSEVRDMSVGIRDGWVSFFVPELEAVVEVTDSEFDEFLYEMEESRKEDARHG